MRRQFDRKRMLEAFNAPLLGGGIFVALNSLDVPWQDEINPIDLDMDYFGNHSGMKYVSNLVDAVMKQAHIDQLDITHTMNIASVLKSIYGRNWQKQWETMLFEYNPIENYDMHEVMTDDETVDEYGRTTTRTDNLKDTRNGSETNTYGHTTTRTDNLRNTRTGSESDVYGKSSLRTDNLTSTRTGSESEQHSDTNTRTDNLVNTKTGSESNQHTAINTRTDDLQSTRTGSESEQHSDTTTRTDNLTNTKTGSETETVTPNDRTKTTERQIAGYNADEYENSEKEIVVESGSETKQTTYNRVADAQTGTQQTQGSGTASKTYNSVADAQTGTQETEETGTDTKTYNRVADAQTGTQQTQGSGTASKTYNSVADAQTGTQQTQDGGTDSHQYNNVADAQTGTQTHAESGSDTHAYTDLEDAHTGTQRHEDGGSDTHTRNYDLRRSGNVGVTTSQQMIESERALWMWNFFRDVVYKDLDKVLALSTY